MSFGVSILAVPVLIAVWVFLGFRAFLVSLTVLFVVAYAAIGTLFALSG